MVERELPEAGLGRVCKDKVVKGVDHKTWRRFVAWCMVNGILVGDALTGILEEFLMNDSEGKHGK